MSVNVILISANYYFIPAEDLVLNAFIKLAGFFMYDSHEYVDYLKQESVGQMKLFSEKQGMIDIEIFNFKFSRIS